MLLARIGWERAFIASVVWLSFGSVACGSDDGDGGESGTGGAGSAFGGTGGAGEPDPNGVATGGLGTGGGAAQTQRLVAEPVLDYQQQQDAVASGIELISSRFTVEPSGADCYGQWFGAVVNNGTTTVCHVTAAATLRNLSGATVVEYYTYADTLPYRTLAGSSALTIPCLAPGEEGGLWTNYLDVCFNMESVTDVVVELGASDYGAVEHHPLAPTITNAQVVDSYGSSGYWSLEGIVKASTAGDVYNVGLTVYPRNASGLVLDQLLDFHLETLFAGATWSFSTSSWQGAVFSDYLQFVDFIEGTDDPYRVVFGDTPVGRNLEQQRKLREASRVRREAWEEKR